jgi:flavorubredoxin
MWAPNHRVFLPSCSAGRFYYDCLMKPNAKSVTTALRKVAGLQYNTIANGHGPVLRYAAPGGRAPMFRV